MKSTNDNLSFSIPSANPTKAELADALGHAITVISLSVILRQVRDRELAHDVALAKAINTAALYLCDLGLHLSKTVYTPDDTLKSLKAKLAKLQAEARLEETH